MTTAPITIIGKGAFGSALAAMYSAHGRAVSLYGRDLPAQLPGNCLLLAVPSSAVTQVSRTLDAKSHSDAVFVLCCKGLLANGDLPSAGLPPNRAHAVLSGPGYAHELAAGLPTVHSLAAARDIVADLSAQLTTPSFRLYPTNDAVGVQLLGSIKNMLAVAVGIADGLALGENAKAALVARGVVEIQALLARYGGRAETLLAPAGIGDIVLTCTSTSSRNFRFGQALAEPRPDLDAARQAIGTVEAYHSLPGLVAGLADQREAFPILSTLERVMFGGLAAKNALGLLLERPLARAC